jgi:hypothetical protein
MSDTCQCCAKLADETDPTYRTHLERFMVTNAMELVAEELMHLRILDDASVIKASA